MYNILMPLGQARSNKNISDQLEEFTTSTLPYVALFLYLVLFIATALMIFLVCQIVYEMCTSGISAPRKRQPSNSEKLQIFDLERYSSAV
ncbi:unnamed protein product [Bursaphelenchus xylophilus]|uniref:(pine wood nematode) hypothetical protein n=1 Tax=Bursaphelenchus xylophilus TaxID=6326 RepID=A0A1I7RVK4_BURXY|nr:unnamed protein product [Bursaphelenchus xylophilus]CAG9081805.1 unnamed protein product [Bursaphelenchus xylophilus]